MLTCSCTYFGLTCRCYFGRQRINGTRQKKLETLPTLVRASTAPSSLRLYQQPPVAPQALLDVVSCSCTAEGNACSGTRCSCNNAGLSCTEYGTCDGGVGCFSRFTIKQMNSEDNEVSLSASDDDDEGQYHVYI